MHVTRIGNRVDYESTRLWLLCSARVIAANQTLTKPAGFPDPTGTPIAHFSRRLDVRVAAP